MIEAAEARSERLFWVVTDPPNQQPGPSTTTLEDWVRRRWKTGYAHGGVLAAAEYEALSAGRSRGVHHTCAAGGHTGRVAVIDAAMLRPDAQQRVLVSGLLAELGSASAAELSADLRPPVVTITAVLGVLERSGRARRVGDGWEHVEAGPQPPRRSWRVGGTIVD